VLASDYDEQSYAADGAGFLTGDAIVSIEGKDIRSFSDIQEAFALSAEQRLAVVLERDGRRIETTVTPQLDRETGAGRVGIYPWVDGEVESLTAGSPLRLAGLSAGDRIVAVDGVPVRHGIDLIRYLELKRPERPVLSYERSGVIAEATLVLSYAEGLAPDLGIGWRRTKLTIRSDNAFAALADGWNETIKTIAGTYRGLASLFKGVDVFRAVSGPARITWVVGQVATESFSTGMASGLTVSFNFLAILSIGLFAMNLLPIPLLDGGWILLFIAEALRGKAAKVKTVFRYQTIGIVAVAGLFLLSTIADILFFSGR
jgi:regulator of sigma E protease